MIKILLEKGTNKATLEIPGEYTHPIVVGELIQNCITFVENGGKLEIPFEKSKQQVPISTPSLTNKNNNTPGRPKQVSMIGQRSEMPLIRDAFEKAGLIFKDDLVEETKVLVKEEPKMEKKPEPKEEKVPEVKVTYPSVKEKNGKKLYQCYYWCKNPECGHRGKHFIPLERKIITCHNCGTEHLVRPAAREVGHDGVPKQDKFGNYFVAHEVVTKEPEKVSLNEVNLTEIEETTEASWPYKMARKSFVCENNGCNNDIPKGVGYYQKGKGKRICSICNDRKAN